MSPLLTTHPPARIFSRGTDSRRQRVFVRCEIIRAIHQVEYCGQIYELSPQQYAGLKEGLSLPAKESAEADEPVDADLDEDLPSHADLFTWRDEFDQSEWETVPLVGMPATPQPPPMPLIGAENYHSFIGIPALNKRSYAKREINLRRQHEQRERLCAERKALFVEWQGRLRKTYDSLPHERPIRALRCARCGSEWFHENSTCRDCAQNMRGYDRKAPSIENIHGVSRRTLTSGRRKKRMSPDEFVLALLLNRRSRLDWLTNHGEMQKTLSAARVLLGDEFPKNVAADTGESLRAIESRCERLRAALREYAASGFARPEIEPVHLILLHKSFPNGESLDDVIDRYLRDRVFVNGNWVKTQTMYRVGEMRDQQDVG